MERFKKLGIINENELHHTVFYNLKDQMGLQKPIYLTEELKTYVDIYFLQVSDDYVTVAGKNTQKTKRFEARQCTQDDFGSEKWEKAFYDSWEGFSIICPDIPEGEHF